MKDFQINYYLSVRLENEETKIYVAGEPFIQCKFLLLNIPITQVSSFDEIQSIDEAAEKVDEITERKIIELGIPPEVEFWGHCSNLQVWYENNYDTRLIHSNLAFPLLQRLTEAGDPLAKKVFKQEILKRYKDGTERTRDYLAAEGFLKYITLDEQLNILLDTNNLIALTELIEEVWPDRNPYTLILDLIGEEVIKIENQTVVKLSLPHLELSEFPIMILNLNGLEYLSLHGNRIKVIPEEINKLKSLKELWLSSNELTQLPDSLCEITSLEVLWLDGNKIYNLPKKIGNLIHLEILRLIGNKLQTLPDSFCNLPSLIELYLSDNNLIDLPECIGKINSLEYLDVSRNPLTDNPRFLEKIKKVKIKKIDF